MSRLRVNIQVLSVILGGIVFFLVAILQIDPDEFGPIFAVLLLPFAFKDIRFLFVSWFVLSVYYAKSGVDAPPNYAANISHNALVPLITMITAAYYFVRRRKVHFGIEEIAMLAFITYSIISATLFATDKYTVNRTTILNYVLPLCLYWMVKNMDVDDKVLKQLGLASLFHLVVLLPVGIYEYLYSKSLFLAVFRWDDVGGHGRISGPLGSPIILGCLIPILYFHIYTAVRLQLLPRYVLWFSGALSSVLIILTFTRSVWLGALLAFIFVFLAIDENKKKRVLQAAGLVVASIAAILVMVAASPDVEKRLTGEENANFRVVMAQASLDMISDRVWTGWGAGRFDEIVDRYLFDARGVYITKDTSHVTLLTLLAELGIAGTVFFVAFIALAFMRNRIPLKHLPPEDRLIAAANMASLICLVINAFLIDMRFYGLAYAWLFTNLAFLQNIYLQNQRRLTEFE